MVIDSVPACWLEVGDLVLINQDHIEITDVSDELEIIHIRGVSFNTGDVVDYLLDSYDYIDIWSDFND